MKTEQIAMHKAAPQTEASAPHLVGRATSLVRGIPTPSCSGQGGRRLINLRRMQHG